MSTESKVGARLFELKKFVQNNLTTACADYKQDVSLSDDQYSKLVTMLNASVDSSFNTGIKNVLSAVK